MKIEIFNSEIITKEYACQKNTCNDLYKIKEPYINMYVKVTESCQAHCKFCEFCTQEKSEFDVYKLYYVITELQKKVKINKISFTGGEVSLNAGKFKSIIEMVKNACPNAFIVINTNGYDLDSLIELDGIDSISLSRHHYNEKTNMEIFKVGALDQLPLNSELQKDFKNKDKIHLSCNLIKGHIDSFDEMCKYLDWAGSLKIHDVGFVTLMKVNDYCREHHVDFRDIISENNRLMIYQTWKNKDLCSCSNYVYNPTTSDQLVKVYARYNHDYLKGNESNLVFDGAHLRNGFYGDIVI